MPPRINLIGLRFGKLMVMDNAKSKTRKARYLCKCDCGNSTIVRSENLRIGKTKSCGCSAITHGHTLNKKWSKTYSTWYSMLQRCRNINSTKYSQYGAKGITVCGSWSEFENFLKDMGNRPEGKTIDRIDNSKGYYKENCRWATPAEQAQNTSQTRFVTYLGETHCLSEWARKLKLNVSCLYYRLKNNWPIEKVLSTTRFNKIGRR